MDTKEPPKPPVIRHVTEGWHDLSAPRLMPGAISTMLVHGTIGRVCEHYVAFDSPTPTSVMTREGVLLANDDGSPKFVGPGPVRSYIGLVLEVGDAQLQVSGRLRLGDDTLAIEVDE